MNDRHQDFVAAMHEVKSNLDVRRLMFVILHILLPGAVLAIGDCLAGAAHPPELAWFAWMIVPLAGAIVAGVGLVTCLVLMRCHYGLVVNGTKMQRVLTGTHREQGLNWLGVTTNFVFLCALSAGSGAFLLAVSFLPWGVALAVAAVLVVFVCVMLLVNHARANRLVRKLAPSWEHVEVARALREEHTTNSLDGTNADIAIVVTMAAALFVGLFAGMTNLVAIDPQVELPVAAVDVRRYVLPLGGAFLVLSLLLSGRMILRLRVAIAEHSLQLAKLRNEPDDPWKFRVGERTFLLFLVVQFFTGASLVLFLRTFLEAGWALALAGAFLLVAIARYAQVLWSGRKGGKQFVPDAAHGATPGHPSSEGAAVE